MYQSFSIKDIFAVFMPNELFCGERIESAATEGSSKPLRGRLSLTIIVQFHCSWYLLTGLQVGIFTRQGLTKKGRYHEQFNQTF
jgi:hypothetical protein